MREIQGYAITRSLVSKCPVIVKGEGIYVFDEEGNRYIDGASGSSLACNIGHGVKEVAAVMTPQAEMITYNPTHCSISRQFMEMCERLVKLTPEGLDHIFSVSGGSEATETAIKFARQYQVTRGKPSKHTVISRWQGYHGNTIGALSASGHTFRRRKHAPYLLAFPHIPPAYCYRCYFEKTYPDCNLLCARVLENAILQEGAENVSAFIAEPVVGAALGAVPAPDGYFQIIRKICDKYDVLFLADEVMCGLGRTGKNFAIDHWGVVPDMIATAKGMGGGYCPVGACIISSEIVAAIRKENATFVGGFTHAGHLFAARVATAVLDYTVRNNLIQNSAEMGAYLLEGLKSLLDFRIVGDVRGQGLMCGVELVKDKRTKEPFAGEDKVAELVVEAAMQRGLIVYPGHGNINGDSGDHLLIGPPLTIRRPQVEEMVTLLRESLESVEKTLMA